MKKIIKKLWIVGIMVMMVLNTQIESVKAANTYVINGVSIHYTDYSSAPSQCFRYAKNVYTKIWGQSFTGYTTSHNLLNGLTSQEKKLTVENLKNHIELSSLGAVIRITNYGGLYSSADYVGHSQVLVQKDENGFTVVEGGFSASPHRREKYYTWAEYCRVWSGGNYGYLKYIVWPNAIPQSKINPEIKAELEKSLEELKVTRNESFDALLSAKDVASEISPLQYASINYQIDGGYETNVRSYYMIHRLGLTFSVVIGTFGFRFVTKQREDA